MRHLKPNRRAGTAVPLAALTVTLLLCAATVPATASAATARHAVAAAPAAGSVRAHTTAVSAPAASPPISESTLESNGGQEVQGGGIQVGPQLPTPAAPAKDGSVSAGKASKPGLLDIPGQIESAITEWFAGLVKDALNPVMELVGRTLLSTPQVAGQASIRGYWQLCLGVADALLILVIVAAGALVMTHETLQSSYAVKEMLPRLIVAAVAANASLALCGQMVDLANVLAGGLLGGGVNAVQAGHTLQALVLGSVAGGSVFVILLGLACALLAVMLLVLYLVRAAVIVLLVCAAPLMLLAHGLPQTEALARLWWRGMLAALGVQVAQALTLAAAVHVFLATGGSAVLGVGVTGSTVSLLLVLCLFYVLMRIPFWAKDMVLSSRRSPNAVRMAKTYVTYKIVHGTLGGVL